LVPVGFAWVAPPGEVLVPFVGCPGRLAGLVAVALDPGAVAGALRVPDDADVARGAGCPVGWGAAGRWPEPDDCDMTTATAIAAAATAAAIPAVSTRRLGNRAGVAAPPGESAAAGNPAAGSSAPR
jgi:hypothetical protein